MPKKKVLSVAQAAQATIPEYKRIGVDLPLDLALLFKQHCVMKNITITTEVERLIRQELGVKMVDNTVVAFMIGDRYFRGFSKKGRLETAVCLSAAKLFPLWDVQELSKIRDRFLQRKLQYTSHLIGHVPEVVFPESSSVLDPLPMNYFFVFEPVDVDDEIPF